MENTQINKQNRRKQIWAWMKSVLVVSDDNFSPLWFFWIRWKILILNQSLDWRLKIGVKQDSRNFRLKKWKYVNQVCTLFVKCQLRSFSTQQSLAFGEDWVSRCRVATYGFFLIKSNFLRRFQSTKTTFDGKKSPWE